MPHTTKVVIDTNVLISYLLSAPGSTIKNTVSDALENNTILFSSSTFAELSSTLSKKKFDSHISIPDRQKFLFLIKEVTKITPIIENIEICRDKKDNQFLEVAINGKADFIITGDKDLLVLNGFRKIKILSPKDFSELNIGK